MVRADFKLVRCPTCKKELAVTKTDHSIFCETCNRQVFNYWHFKKRTILSEEQKEQIRKEYLARFDPTEAWNCPSTVVSCKRYGVSEQTIRNILYELSEFRKYLSAMKALDRGQYR
jgi:endogenous inhibitor of DNA gyrase (YacG/DUF329 family)